jgi:hypothetical protein
MERVRSIVMLFVPELKVNEFARQPKQSQPF